MDVVLDTVEARILGSLIEKELTTPDYYPLTLNSLVAACNQKSNRHPMVAYDEAVVVRGIDALQRKGFLAISHMTGSRVVKYRQLLDKKISMNGAEQAILCELLLRGPQTLGELRTRCERMHPLESLQAVEEALTGLAGRETPLVTQLPRQTGMKECRYGHLFCGQPEVVPVPEPRALAVGMEQTERIIRLEEEMATLRAEVTSLREELSTFRSQFA
ncbi:MAG: YceH family protein [Nitrospirota bacterium]|nr:YceH family protein [Nitrospirota bacterium]